MTTGGLAAAGTAGEPDGRPVDAMQDSGVEVTVTVTVSLSGKTVLVQRFPQRLLAKPTSTGDHFIEATSAIMKTLVTELVK